MLSLPQERTMVKQLGKGFYDFDDNGDEYE